MTTSSPSLQSALRAERLSTYARLRGGYPIPLAGATSWALLALAGTAGWSPTRWSLVAFYTSGLIFPMAIGYARLLKVDFLRDRSAVGDALMPAFVSMLLFWPIAIAALWSHPPLVPLILAIGMSIHWPVIGWTYGKPLLYSAHAVVRAIVAFAIWQWLPSQRFTLLPLWVAAIYVLTVVAILVDTRPRAIRGTAALE